MRDRELYQKILGIEPPSKVVCVELAMKGGEVRVHVTNLEPKLPCRQCRQICSRSDTRARRSRHLGTCQYPAVLVGGVAFHAQWQIRFRMVGRDRRSRAPPIFFSNQSFPSVNPGRLAACPAGVVSPPSGDSLPSEVKRRCLWY